MSTSVSPLGPIDPDSVPEAETEKSAPWIVRKLVGSMTGRIVRSSWETLRASGTSVICLSPWGDSSPLLLPCIRFRDLAVHTIIAATGGVAAVAAPVMGPVSDAVVSTFGDTILVEMGMHVGFDLTAKAANDLIFDGTIHELVPIHSSRLQTTGIKTMTITLKYKHLPDDASLGFYRSGIHKDNSLFSSVMDYLSIEKGWFSPYLFASGRRPVIPRSVKPDIVFCHGPFLSGDYRLGETLLAESAQVISFTKAPPPPAPSEQSTLAPLQSSHSLSLKLPSLSQTFARSRTPSPEPALAPLPPPPQPRRLVVLAVGLKPHRAGLWTTSQRPSESVIQYQLLNGCPAIVVPARLGAPLLAWDTLTLEQLWKVQLPEGDGPQTASKDGKFEGIVGVLYEFLDLCVDWERLVLSTAGEQGGESAADKEEAVKDAVEVLVAAAVRSGASKAVKDEIDKERAGIAMWRIP
ncbi:hypothetical protein DICSQDRAFT_101872 [Dichomitus squalens LYAD-421 SS1]|uniref:Uncharacterized protein n=1 Tax=Dichomitus squalens TaxID=114155 RepID=A0A4V2K8S4_9APHY|nr:uncharacterized protein DICSQDRAFT_101872 [Dichomitus squalens LYAD-421 SS1]EJF63816.1 hypothetical protein DICSQDRAFT_101872 [Dichomitus squalens LYAD-421 SS1]TBU61138.1 hypothetical protein BD310DRAFT_874245 [Dichomitus squalens]